MLSLSIRQSYTELRKAGDQDDRPLGLRRALRELHRRRLIVLVCLELKPPIRQPIVELADRRRREVGQQLRQVQLRVDVVAAGGAGRQHHPPACGASKATLQGCHPPATGARGESP